MTAEAKTMFLVTVGSYSDYHVAGVFDNRDMAEAYAKAFESRRSDVAEIEEYPLNPFEEQIRAGRYWYRVFMLQNGDSSHADLLVSRPADWDGQPKFGGSFRIQPIKRWMYDHVEATSVEHAIKIANERRTMILANGEWPPDDVVKLTA